jgi:hypothetical protein
MKDPELNKILRSTKLPEAPEEYWEEFPKRVVSRIQWRSGRQGSLVNETISGRRFSTVLRLTCGLAIVCLVAGFVISRFWKERHSGLSAVQLLKARTYYKEIETLFPNQVRGIVFDNQGTHLLLADKPNLPAGAGIYLRICGKDGCRGFVTFSGQQIRVGNDSFDVLLDHKGQVILAGERMIWARDGAVSEDGDYQIEAHALEDKS